MRLSRPPPHRAGSSPIERRSAALRSRRGELEKARQRLHRAPVDVEPGRVGCGVPPGDGVEPAEFGEHRGPLRGRTSRTRRHGGCAARPLPCATRPRSRAGGQSPRGARTGARRRPRPRGRSRASRRPATPAVHRPTSPEGVSSRCSGHGCWGREVRTTGRRRPDVALHSFPAVERATGRRRGEAPRRPPRRATEPKGAGAARGTRRPRPSREVGQSPPRQSSRSRWSKRRSARQDHRTGPASPACCRTTPGRLAAHTHRAARPRRSPRGSRAAR